MVAACAGQKERPTNPPAYKPPQGLGAFDLVPRGQDDNGLPLNPELGWSFFNRTCTTCRRSDLLSQDPRACSWHFLDDRGTKERPSCTTQPMDPDFSTDLSTLLGITCSDSPLRYAGHVNWGRSHGGAVTYDGWLEWEGFSGEWPGDHDLNFILSLEPQNEPGEGWKWIGVEADFHELKDWVGSSWWKDLMVKVEVEKPAVRDHVGVARAQVTGLLGMDAEHMSVNDAKLELHPAYAMALQVPCATCKTDTERWALMVRERGNEGLCSQWERQHVMAIRNGVHTFRIPWSKDTTGKDMTGVEVDSDHTQFCSSEGSTSQVVVQPDPGHGVLVSIPFSSHEIVDGELFLRWHGPAPKKQVAATRAPQLGLHSRELEDPLVAQHQIDALRTDVSEDQALEAATSDRKAQGNCTLSVTQKPLLLRSATPAPLGAPVAAAPVGASVPVPPPIARSAKEKRPSILDTYCEKRAGKSTAAAKFCAERRKQK